MTPDIYSPLHPAAFFMIQRRQRLIRAVLAARHPDGVQGLKLLEVGCGTGQWLAEFQTFGLLAADLAGIDLDPERVAAAGRRHPSADLRVGDAARIPWPDQSFDIVFQSTVFTSILDPPVKQAAAAEMRRVCKPDGFILWYDFAYDNPRNHNVKGVGKREIRGLFQPWRCRFHSVTLAPPIARPLAELPWMMSELAETLLPFLRTHLLAIIAPEG
jgi:ubiquinone/menaquinone biosynthesis C-methylase UbiE